MKFTQIPSDTFQKLAMNAGVLTYEFDPTASPVVFEKGHIIGATSGGITVTAVPTFADFGEDVDNCAKNTKEMKRIVAYDITASGTFVTIDPKVATDLLASGERTVTTGVKTTDTAIKPGKLYYTRSGSGTSQSPYVYTEVENPVIGSIGNYYEAITTKIIPSHTLASGNFKDIWFVGDYSDKNTGNTAGYMACKIKNALSTGGLSLVTADQEKGKFAFEFTGHYSINAADTVPFEIYVHTGT